MDGSELLLLPLMFVFTCPRAAEHTLINEGGPGKGDDDVEEESGFGVRAYHITYHAELLSSAMATIKRRRHCVATNNKLPLAHHSISTRHQSFRRRVKLNHHVHLCEL
jgi:hypothetical protein